MELSLNPSVVDETTLRVPVPRSAVQLSTAKFLLSPCRPDMQTRTQLTKKASDLAENARISIRAARHQGQKDLKADQDNKVVGEGDARKDTKHVRVEGESHHATWADILSQLQDATKKRTDEVDQIFAQARKLLMDE